MAHSTIANIVANDQTAAYVAERSLVNTKLFQTGALITDPFLNELAQESGKLIDFPYWQDLSGAEEILADDGSSLTVNAITAAEQVARRMERGKVFGATDLAAQRSGDDPMGFALNRIGVYWGGRNQLAAMNVAVGVFADNADNDSSDMIYDASATVSGAALTSADLLSKVTIPLTVIQGGEQSSEYNILWCHPNALPDMQGEELISTVRMTDPELNFDVEYERYMGKFIVITDDALPTATDATTGRTNYTAYIMKPGAFMYADGRCDVPLEIYRGSLESQTALVTRQTTFIHPVGFAWQESSVAGKSPTNAELAAAANWDRVYNLGNTGMVSLIHNCTAG